MEVCKVVEILQNENQEATKLISSKVCRLEYFPDSFTLSFANSFDAGASHIPVSEKSRKSITRLKPLVFVCVFDQFKVYNHKNKLPSNIFKGKKVSIWLLNLSATDLTFDLDYTHKLRNVLGLCIRNVENYKTRVCHTSTWKLKSKSGKMRNRLKINLHFNMEKSRWQKTPPRASYVEVIHSKKTIFKSNHRVRTAARLEKKTRQNNEKIKKQKKMKGARKIVTKKSWKNPNELREKEVWRLDKVGGCRKSYCFLCGDRYWRFRYPMLYLFERCRSASAYERTYCPLRRRPRPRVAIVLSNRCRTGKKKERSKRYRKRTRGNMRTRIETWKRIMDAYPNLINTLWMPSPIRVLRTQSERSFVKERELEHPMQVMQLVSINVQHLGVSPRPYVLSTTMPSEKFHGNIIYVGKSHTSTPMSTSISVSRPKLLRFNYVSERLKIHGRKRKIGSTIFKNKKLSLLLTKPAARDTILKLEYTHELYEALKSDVRKFTNIKKPIHHMSTWQLGGKSKHGKKGKTKLTLGLNVCMEQLRLQKNSPQVQHELKTSYKKTTTRNSRNCMIDQAGDAFKAMAERNRYFWESKNKSRRFQETEMWNSRRAPIRFLPSSRVPGLELLWLILKIGGKSFNLSPFMRPKNQTFVVFRLGPVFQLLCSNHNPLHACLLMKCEYEAVSSSKNTKIQASYFRDKSFKVCSNLISMLGSKKRGVPRASFYYSNDTLFMLAPLVTLGNDFRYLSAWKCVVPFTLTTTRTKKKNRKMNKNAKKNKTENKTLNTGVTLDFSIRIAHWFHG